MPGIWVVGEPGADGGLARISAEVATLGRTLSEVGGGAVTGVVVAADPRDAAKEFASFLPRVIALTDAEADASRHAWSAIAAERTFELVEAAGDGGPDLVLVGAGPDGRDLAGTLSALLGWGVLANATGVAWSDGRPTVEMSVFGGKLLTTSGFSGRRGIVTVRPNVVAAEPMHTPGSVESVFAAGARRLPAVRVLERVAEAAAAAPIEEAKILVAGGRGLGGPDGFRLVEELANALGGAVGATRAAVDAGWINYSQQVGQTGKIVKPQLYLALGISGAIQHKVGMQTAEAIVAVNRDPDAPIAEFSDLMVVGDLFEVGPALLAELRSRSG
ncbi:MAG: electron transfer flavoprotein subunit alpha/FixB family protein [Candidatus Limnocylindrales bacterium]